MTDVENIYHDPCKKIDPWCVDAFFELKLTPSDSAELTLDNSWNSTSVDLTPAVKSAETITHLSLTPTALQYNREDYGRDGAEDGGVDCINGDDLSRIISMKYLKDVEQVPLNNGDVYMFNNTLELFRPYNLQSFIDQTTLAITQINNKIDNLQSQVNAINIKLEALEDYTRDEITKIKQEINNYETTTNNRLNRIETTIAKPSYVPSSSTLAWGTINTERASAPTTQGIWTHNPSTNVNGDQQFD